MHQSYFMVDFQILSILMGSGLHGKLIVENMHVLGVSELSLPTKAVTHSSMLQYAARNHGKRAINK